MPKDFSPFTKSLLSLKKFGLDSTENIIQLHEQQSNASHGSGLHIAIEIADSNHFLSATILRIFFQYIESAWKLATVLQHLQSADLISDFAPNNLKGRCTTNNINEILVADLQQMAYHGVMSNLQHLHDLEFEMRYLARQGLLKTNINQVFKTVLHANAIGLALHDLNGAVRLDQVALNKLYADPENARSISVEIIKTPLFPAIREVPKITKEAMHVKNYPKPPKITLRG